VSFEIRPVTNADCVEVVRIVRAVYDEYGFSWDESDYHADLYDLEGHFTSRGDHFWIAEDETGGLGVVGLCFYDQLKGEPGEALEIDGKVRAAGTDCSLERLYVHPSARRRGIGAAMTELVVETAKQENRKAMELWSDKRFGDAHRLYARFGAQTIGERICHDPDQSPEWGLVIKL
jgi:GNAT superfamily N-acetyltransferase